MFIQTESTPNPNTLKFLPGVEVLDGSPVSFNSKKESANSPLGRRLFEVSSVISVFFGSDFISVTKSEQTDWDIIKPEILVTIMEHFVSGQPVISSNDKDNEINQDISEEDDEITKQLKELIETRVRPAVAQDGGDIIFKSFKDGIVKLELHGACSGCPSSSITLKDGIENMLKHYVPEVKSVEAM
jgi:NFU1 iron-sulfur cluster scaffold homolog, mitochondrial